eukprot:GEMP01078839.1.p1 GENE.GEMP01078839.1~~GEMP01078839.1.p1  ORF type:complete len:140 (+),score=4.35 GEMP01078839.1:377-796(+)
MKKHKKRLFFLFTHLLSFAIFSDGKVVSEMSQEADGRYFQSSAKLAEFKLLAKRKYSAESNYWRRRLCIFGFCASVVTVRMSNFSFRSLFFCTSEVTTPVNYHHFFLFGEYQNSSILCRCDEIDQRAICFATLMNLPEE